MAIKIVQIDGIGEVRISKRRGAKNMRISIVAGGDIRVSLPNWTPYQVGIEFAKSKAVWIAANRPAEAAPILPGYRIGKAHRIVFESAAIDNSSSRLVGTEIRIIRPTGMAVTHADVQKVAQAASIRALRTQAVRLLPKRLEQLAAKYGFEYRSIKIRMLTGRWGSCDIHQDIVLNLFLMQLPWELIDYVLLHELIHTKHLNHSVDFWNEFQRHEPNAKLLRTRTRYYKPQLKPVDGNPVVS